MTVFDMHRDFVDRLLWEFREWAFVELPQILQLCARALQRAPFPTSMDDAYGLSRDDKYTARSHSP